MFTIPADVRDGTRIVRMTDGAYEAKVGMEINAPLDISRILRVAGGEEDGAGSQLAASPGETTLMRIIRKVVTTILWKIRTWPTRFAGAWLAGVWFLVRRVAATRSSPASASSSPASTPSSR